MRQYTLKELRARKNMTQADIAKEIGVSPQTYNAWEKSVSNVSIHHPCLTWPYKTALADWGGTITGT